MKSGIGGNGLIFYRYLLVNPSKNVHELELVSVLFQHLTKSLDEPGSVLCVSPGKVTYRAKHNQNITDS